jgi:NDP-sugar pyrophosphorylase family protein
VKAMIFAAGLGTRLRPVTEKIPKALVEVGGIPMIERVIANLKAAGVSDVIINLHHHPEKIIAFLSSHDYFNINIRFSDETGQLLETGGGLKKAAWFFDDGKPFIVHNTDVITNLDLSKMLEFHNQKKPLATLFIKKRKTSRYLLFDNSMQLCGWKNTKTKEQIISRETKGLESWAFNGIHIIDPSIFEHLKCDGKFSIIPEYLKLAKNFAVLGYPDNDSTFIDVGKPESLREAEKLFGENDQ